MKKKIYIVGPIVAILIIMAATRPSSEEYHAYLKTVHGLNCESKSNGCMHTNLDLMTERILTLPFFMTASTWIFGEQNNEIRVLGIFNHFFVLENKLKPK
ncbi:hypothetical protein [Paenibacillus planticolens]|uniref:Uncharacterized protein n=1 Tax=Paenibacillus planticolens TaxID=2654976 RepID=A0ABX1ZRF8_9BACL|nr:hypothetical protein [Paenibacillus planticolens]NOV01185.1 hypothetical protein [Paenibacillus planticolens]